MQKHADCVSRTACHLETVEPDDLEQKGKVMGNFKKLELLSL